MKVLLLHAWPLDERMWEPQLGPLREAGFEPLAPRLYGRGAVIDGWAARLLDELHGPFVAVGASMGGHCALALARRAPERLVGQNEITFTRSRPYKKNDSCFIEQKNYSVVRRNVGYLRYDTKEELSILNELYIYLDYYTNYFQPVVKLVLKTRVGSRVTKKYDIAKTPFRRVLESEFIDDKIKERLKIQYDSLNPADLKKKISELQDKLLKLNVLKSKVRKGAVINEEAYGYSTG